MGIIRVDSIYDMEAIGAEHAKFKEFVKEDTSALLALYEAAKASKGSTIGSFAADTEKAGTAISNTKKKQDELSLAVKEYSSLLNTTSNNQAKANALQSDAGVEAAKTTIQLQAQKKANKEVAQEALGLIDVYGKMKKEYVELANVAKNLSAISLKTGNPEDVEKAKQATAAAKELHDQLLTIESGVGQSQRNVGNYTGAINILKTSLEEATAQLAKLNEANSANANSTQQLQTEYNAITQKINQQRESLAILNSLQEKAGTTNITYANDVNNVNQSLTSNLELQYFLTQQIEQNTVATNQNNEVLQKTQSEVSLLSELVGQQSNGFTSLSREVMNTGKALETMHEQGLQGTAAFAQLEHEFVEGKRKLTEFRNEQKLLTDTAPKIAALTIAARGLGGAYAAGAGATALFAEGNEKVEKELNKLVAIMTLLQGLQELHHFIMEKNAIATALFGRSTEVATISLEGEAVAAEGAAASTGAFGKALLFIQANPIVLFLTALAGVLIYLISTYKSEEEQLKENAKASKEYSDAIKDETDIIEEQNKMINKNLELQKKRAQALLEEKQAAGTTSATELAYKIAINEIDQKITDQQLKSHPKINEEIEQQTASVKKLMDQELKQAGQVKELADQKLNGVKRVDKELTDQQKYFLDNAGISYKEDIDDAIDAAKKKGDINKEAITSGLKAIETLQKIKEAKDKADEDAEKLRLAQEKLDADEQRKLALATAQIIANTEQDKNNIILSNEHSTFEQRIKAMKSNQSALKALAKAEEINVTSDPTKSANDKLIAEKQYYAKVGYITKEGKKIQGNIERDGDAEIQKATEENTKRRLTAEEEANKIIINQDIILQQELIDNNNISLADRLIALTKYSTDQKTLIDKEYQFTKATTVLTNEELIKLDADYNAKLVALAVDTHKKKAAITKSESETTQLLRDKDYADTERTFNKISDLQSNQYNTSIIKLNDRYSQGLISLDQYNEQRLKLDNNYSEESIKIEIDRQQSLIDQLDYANRLKINLGFELQQAEEDMDKAKTDQEKIAAAERINIIKDELTKTMALIDKESALYKSMSALLKQLSDAHQKILSANQVKSLKELDNVKEQFGKYSSLIDGALNASSVRLKNKIQDDKSAIDKDTQDKIDAVNKLVITEEEKAARISIIQAIAQSKKDQLDQKQRQADTRQAQFDKLKALFEITIGTAKAIIKDLGNPFKIAVDIALGVAQAAIVLGTQIPKYKMGRGIGKEENAIVGDAGVHEYIHRGDTGVIERTPAIDTMVHLMPKDKVYKDKQTMISEVVKSSQSLSKWNVENNGSITRHDMQEFAGEIVAAIGDIYIHNTNITKDGWEEINKRLADKENWKKKNITGRK